MSDFFGIVSRQQELVKEDWLWDMQRALALWKPDYVKILYQSHFGLGQNSLRITPESLHEHLPETTHGLSLVANARIDNRDELIKLLDVPKAEVITDASLILAAYQKWGTECPKMLIGEFAFAIWDDAERSLFCAKDALGVRPLYYHVGSDFVIISTEIRGVFASKQVPKKLNDVMLAAHLSTFKAEKKQTAFKDIFSLEGAHWLLVKNGNVTKKPYWQPSIYPELRLKNNQEYEEAFCEKLQLAVKRRLRSAYPIGSLMSGGLDSTSITGLALRENLKNPLHILSWAYKENAVQDHPDDREYVNDFLAFHKNANYEHSFVHGYDGYFSLLERFQPMCDQPFLDVELPTRFESYQLFEEKNVRVLMTGIGGDQCATYSASEYPFHLLTQLRPLKAIQTLNRIKQGADLTWRKMAGNYIIKPSIAAFKGVEPWGKGYGKGGKKFLTAKAKKLFIHPDLYERTSFESFVKNHSATQDLPNAFKNPLKNGILMKTFESGLETSFNQRYHVTQHFKMQYTYPLLDRELISFLLSMPADQFHQNGLGRSIVRRSMHSFVPDSILKKTAKIGSAPFIGRIRHRELPLVLDELQSWKKSPLIRETVDLPAFETHVKRLMAGKEQHDRYFVRTVFLCNFLQKSFN